MLDFKCRSVELEKNLHNLEFERFWGLGWAGGGKLDGQHYRFEVGASKLFNNSTTSPVLLKMAKNKT
jgi:hypothetical protein